MRMNKKQYKNVQDSVRRFFVYSYNFVFRRDAFSMIEILVVIAIGILLTAFTLLNFVGKRSHADLDSGANEMISVLRDAQGRSVTQSLGTAWGVHLDNSGAAPFFSIFNGAAYATTTQSGFYRLPSDVCYSNSSLPKGQNLDVTFAPITGTPSVATSVILELRTDCVNGGTLLATSSIAITMQGLIASNVPLGILPPPAPPPPPPPPPPISFVLSAIHPSCSGTTCSATFTSP